MTPPSLADKLVAVHRALDAAGLPHAFGGALALAWCTRRPRGTSDLDVNVFVDASRAAAVLEGLPAEVTAREDDLIRLRRDGQARLWWDRTPIDLFLNTTDFHEEAAGRARPEPFKGTTVPFLACEDLAVFKAFFNRTRDWADLEEMAAAGTLDVNAVREVLAGYVGADDERVARLAGLAVPG
jgi:hypothetical protein